MPEASAVGQVWEWVGPLTMGGGIGTTRGPPKLLNL